MDLLLLGAAAIVLVALTLWLVWRPAEVPERDVRAQEENQMLPQGDQFEDQYTSATADLSAGGLAVTAAQNEEPPLAEPSAFQRAGEPWSEPSLAHESAPAALDAGATKPALPEPSVRTRLTQPKAVGMGVAVLLTLGTVLGGAWVYSHRRRKRRKPVSRVLRSLK